MKTSKSSKGKNIVSIASLVAMLLVIAFVLNMQAIMAEYAAMGVVGGIVFAVLANITMLMYDRMLLIMYVIYLRKLRPTLMGGR